MIFRSAHPDVAIPPVPLHEYVLRHAQRLANKPALIDGPSGRTLTHGQLAGAIRACAAGLAARGYKVEILTTSARDHYTWANELPEGMEAPGSWMHEALTYRERWRSQLLRTAPWSPVQ